MDQFGTSFLTPRGKAATYNRGATTRKNGVRKRASTHKKRERKGEARTHGGGERVAVVVALDDAEKAELVRIGRGGTTSSVNLTGTTNGAGAKKTQGKRDGRS